MRSDSRQVTCYHLSINPREDFDFVDLVQLTNFVFDLCDIHNGLSPPKYPNIVQHTSLGPILFSMGCHCFCVEHRGSWRNQVDGIIRSALVPVLDVTVLCPDLTPPLNGKRLSH